MPARKLRGGHAAAAVLAVLAVAGCAAHRTVAAPQPPVATRLPGSIPPATGAPVTDLPPVSSPVSSPFGSPLGSPFGSPRPGTGTGPGPSPSPASPLPAGAPVRGVPATYLAIDGRGLPRLARVDAATGAVLEELTPAEGGGGPGAPTLPSDHSVIYYQQGAGRCAAEILQLPAGGGEPAGAFRGGGPGYLDNTGEADVTPSVRPDGGLLAFGRTACWASSSVSTLAFVDTGTRRQVFNDADVEAPASSQAWSPDGTELLAVRRVPGPNPAPTEELHLLKVGRTGIVAADRVLATPQAGCAYGQARFAPVTANIFAELHCASGSSIVELNSVTGKVLATVVPAAPGTAVELGPIDPSGQDLAYGSTAGPAAQAWFVLRAGKSAPLPAASQVTPAAW
jgi:hypothetical protein